MTKALGRQWFVSPRQQIVAELLQILLQIALEFHHVAHLLLVTGCVIVGEMKVEQQLLASEVIPCCFHVLSVCGS